MGSGGLRGLQIPRSGVKSARGGFDSHTFPPIVCLIGAALLGPAGAGRTGVALAAVPGVAAESPTPLGSAIEANGDSLGVHAPDTAGRVLPRRGDGPRAVNARAGPHPPWGDQPRWVMVRSLLVPGWGQFHNRAWFKAGGIAAAEGALGAALVRDSRELDRLNQRVLGARASGDVAAENAAVSAYNDRLDHYVARQWLLAGVIAYAVVDAYVDAHFRHFRVEFEHDPALPEGFSNGPGGRLSLRWDF